MKKLIVGLFTLALAFGFVACSNLESTTTSTADAEEVAFESDSQVFTLEALSAANLLDAVVVMPTSFTPLADEVTTDAVTTETEEETTDAEEIIIDNQIDEIDQYLEMVEGFLGDNNGLSATVLTSDREEYANLISFSTVNLLGEEVVYYMYYNETLYVSEDPVDDTTTTTETETTTEATSTEIETTTTVEETTTTPVSYSLPYSASGGDKEQNFYFEDDDDNEVVYLLEGLIISNGIEYSVEGKRIVEDNGDEVLRLRSFVDKDNYVVVSYKLDAEDSKEKFFFEVVTDGVVVSKAKVMVAEEDGELKVFLDLSDNGDEAKYVFKIAEEDNVTFYHIRYTISLTDGTEESGNVIITATLDEATGIITYDYIVQDVLHNGHMYENHGYESRHQHEDRSENRNGEKNKV